MSKIKSFFGSLNKLDWYRGDDDVSGKLKEIERDLAILARAILHAQKTMNGFWSMDDLERIAKKYKLPY